MPHNADNRRADGLSAQVQFNDDTMTVTVFGPLAPHAVSVGRALRSPGEFFAVVSAINDIDGENHTLGYFGVDRLNDFIANLERVAARYGWILNVCVYGGELSFEAVIGDDAPAAARARTAN